MIRISWTAPIPSNTFANKSFRWVSFSRIARGKINASFFFFFFFARASSKSNRHYCRFIRNGALYLPVLSSSSLGNTRAPSSLSNAKWTPCPPMNLAIERCRNFQIFMESVSPITKMRTEKPLDLWLVV